MSLKFKQDSKQQQQDLSYGPKGKHMYQSVFNLQKHDSLCNTTLNRRQNRPTERILKDKTGKE
jgi:hypothetical protein